MLAALTLLVILTLSVVIVRIAAVALRLTGLPDDVARFQARSAFTGAGFTTSESEAHVHHPLRRRIVGLLMVVGNIGLVTVSAMVIVSLVESGRAGDAVLTQLAWLAGVIVLVWVGLLNPAADRTLCAAIGLILHRHRSFRALAHDLLLQCPDDHGVFRVRIAADAVPAPLADVVPSGGLALCLHRADGTSLQRPDPGMSVHPLDEIYVYAADQTVSRSSPA
ncbi:MAG: hypothetical protein AAGL24_06420 [Pseudomonadota bacterium]